MKFGYVNVTTSQPLVGILSRMRNQAEAYIASSGDHAVGQEIHMLCG
jgi:hypothetical protein